MDRGTQWIGRDGAVAQAIAAAELALWDLAGQRADLPVCRLLTQRPERTVRAYASGKVGATPERTHARLLADMQAGFDAFKIGWPPFGATEEGDCAFLIAARDALGDRGTDGGRRPGLGRAYRRPAACNASPNTSWPGWRSRWIATTSPGRPCCEPAVPCRSQPGRASAGCAA